MYVLLIDHSPSSNVSCYLHIHQFMKLKYLRQVPSFVFITGSAKL